MKVRKRDLVGRTIVAVDFRSWHDGTKQIHDPIITLDNGKKIWFVTQETETGSYGTAICTHDSQGRRWRLPRRNDTKKEI